MILKNKIEAFSLAETLIALGIIGLVCAITLPGLMTNVTERINSEKEANIVQKINKSMSMMYANGKLLEQYSSTDAFVDELEKYLKIAKRCNASNIDNCWPVKKVINGAGKETSVARVKKGIHLNLPNNKSNNVGLVLADGTPIIISYDTDAKPLGDSDPLTNTTKELSVGFGKTKEFAYSSNAMDSIAFVMDTNGTGGPNSETVNGKQHDIRSFNGARFAGCPGKEIEGYGCVYTTKGNYTRDEATQICSNLGMKIPDKTTAQNICLQDVNKQEITKGNYWTTTYTFFMIFHHCGGNNHSNTTNDVLCIDN